MDTKSKILAVAIVTVAAMAIIGYSLINSTLSAYAPLAEVEGGPGEFDGLAKCLSEKGISMAGAEWCSACKKQKALFGASFSLVDYKNCDLEADWCRAQEIQYFLTWVFPDGSKVVGVQPPEKLAGRQAARARMQEPGNTNL